MDDSGCFKSVLDGAGYMLLKPMEAKIHVTKFMMSTSVACGKISKSAWISSEVFSLEIPLGVSPWWA